MFGLGLSLFQRVFKGGMSYVYDNLKLFFSFKKHQDTPISHASAGSTSFDGTNDYVEIADSDDLSFGDGSTDSAFSISAWINMDDATNFFITTKDDYSTASNREYTFRIDGSDRLQMMLMDESAGGDVRIGRYDSSALTAYEGSWIHVVGTYTGSGVASGISLYLNAVNVDDTDFNSGSYVAMENKNQPVQIGARVASSNYANGSIANVGIWSRALSASEVQGVMYKKYADLSSAEQVSLVSWYGLDADYNDAHGSNNGTNNGSTLNATIYGDNAPSKPRILDSAPDVVDNYGTLHSGTALSFDGSNDYVNLGDGAYLSFGDDTNDSPFTFSAWINADDLSDFPILAKGVYNSTAEYSWMFNGSDQLRLEIYDDSNSTYESVRTDALTSLQGKWTHCVVTYDGRGGTSANQGITLYVNGSAQSLTLGGAGTYGAMKDKGADAYICRANTTYGDGKISSVKIFNSALTLAQIQEMYLNPEQILPTGVASSNLKLWLPLQEGSGTTNYDGSGNQNHGTITGATWVKAETEIAQVGLVRQNKPMVFDYSNDYVEIMSNGTGTFSNQSFTISAWVKFDTVDADHTIFSYDFTSHAGTYYACHLRLRNIEKLFFAWNDGSSDQNITSTSTYLANTWYHVVCTFTSGSQKMYVNGSLEASSTRSDTITYYAQEVWIGKSNNSYLMDGLISEVAVWDEALTATEVTALYNSGTPLDASADSGNYASSDGLQGYWRNDGDTTWTDRSTNSNHGTVAGSPDSIVLTEGITSGRDSQGFYLTDTTENCLTLNGAEYVEIPDSDVLDNIFENGGTFGMWVYPTIGTSNQALVDKTKHSIDIRNQNLITVNQIFSGTNGQWKSDADTITLNQWQHIVIAYNSSSNANNPIFYINGSSITVNRTITPSGTFTSDVGSTLRFGTENATTDWLLGKMDDIRIYSKVLSATEVTKNYNAGLSKHRN